MKRILIPAVLLCFLCSCTVVYGEGPASNVSQNDSAVSESAADPPEQMKIVYKVDENIGNELLLVNKEHTYSPESAKTVTIYGNKTAAYSLRAVDLCLCPVALEAFDHMMSDYISETDDKTVNVIAAWRDTETQTRLWNKAEQNHGLSYAEDYIARPGHSEHHTGLAVDLAVHHSDGTGEDFDRRGDREWVYSHLADYGFIQRYPKEKTEQTGYAEESWHFRYVGIPHASVMAERGLCLEEYISLLLQTSADGDHLEYQGYEIYCCPETEIKVPIVGDYHLSYDNLGHVIVTVLP